MAMYQDLKVIKNQLRSLKDIRRLCEDNEVCIAIDSKIHTLETVINSVVIEEYNPLSTRFDNW